MKVPPKRKGNLPAHGSCHASRGSLNESPSEKEGKLSSNRNLSRCFFPSMKVPPKRKGNLTESVVRSTPRSPSMKVPPKRKGNGAIGFSPKEERYPSMKVPPKRKGNSYPKIARNHAAETGASREPRGGYTQNYTLQPHLPPHNSLAREETMRATRHVPVTYQVLAHTKTPAGCFLSDPARVLTYERGWRGSGKPD